MAFDCSFTTVRSGFNVFYSHKKMLLVSALLNSSDQDSY